MSDKVGVPKPNAVITAIRDEMNGDIELMEEENDFPPRSLFVQLGLHIYKYAPERLFQCTRFREEEIKNYSLNRGLLFQELQFLTENLRKDMPTYRRLENDAGVCRTPESEKKRLTTSKEAYLETGGLSAEKQVFFRCVEAETGALFQERIHYIHVRRRDTRYEFGLFYAGAQIPFAYAAFSPLDRQYLQNLLLSQGVPERRLLVLTRAFCFPGSPYNAMSALYGRCFRYLKKEVGDVCVVTALNQNLFFDGASLRGAEFHPFALVPMKYYYRDGRYVTRRRAESGEQNYEEQKFPAGDIIWYQRGVSLRATTPAKGLSVITDEMYDMR